MKAKKEYTNKEIDRMIGEFEKEIIVLNGCIASLNSMKLIKTIKKLRKFREEKEK